jgi:hypothetical protein
MMTPGFAKSRAELPWLPYPEKDRVIINAHNLDGGSSYDTDAAAYIAAVEAADGASLATKYADAINDFVVGAKADGIWSSLAAACFLAGPATLAGALVPLVGTAPTNVNFASGDHNQATGLVGNGSSKYLDSNRASNADGQNDVHHAVWVSAAPTATSQFIGVGAATGGATHIVSSFAVSGLVVRCRTSSSSEQVGSQHNTTGLKGINRSSSTGFNARSGGSNTNYTVASQTPVSTKTLVFARDNAGTINTWTNARLGWYSIGPAIDLALLDARLTTYMAAIA